MNHDIAAYVGPFDERGHALVSLQCSIDATKHDRAYVGEIIANGDLYVAVYFGKTIGAFPTIERALVEMLLVNEITYMVNR